VSAAPKPSPTPAAANMGRTCVSPTATPAVTAPTPAPTSGKTGAPRATSAPSSTTSRPTGSLVRNATAPATALRARIGDAGRLEARHLVQDRERALNDRDRKRRAASLTEPEAEIEQRLEPELLEHHLVAGLRRAVRGDHRADRCRRQPRRAQGGRAGDEPVQHHRYPARSAAEDDARGQ